MNVYSINVKIVATAYIRAENEAAAQAVFDRTYREGLGGELPVSDHSPTLADITVTGAQLDDPDLPEVSISPAISFFGAASGEPLPGEAMPFELAHECAPDLAGELAIEDLKARVRRGVDELISDVMSDRPGWEVDPGVNLALNAAIDIVAKGVAEIRKANAES